jgi:hypothetical protein
MAKAGTITVPVEIVPTVVGGGALGLMISEALAAADQAGRIPVEGVLCVEGEPTGDGRLMCAGAIYWDGMLPIPIIFDREDGDHSGVTLGAITEMERRDNGAIWGIGYLSASDDEETQSLVVRARELLEEGAVGVSLRFDSEEVEIRVKRTLIEESAVEQASIDPPEDEMSEDDRIIVARYSADDVIYAFTSCRARHLAIVDTAASATARLEITGAVAAAGIIGEWAGNEHWFNDPQFGDPSVDDRLRYDPDRYAWSVPPTILEDGRVFGHITPQGICLRGRPDRCVTPPDGDLEGFMRGHAPAAGGLRTGVICVGGGHCGVGIGAAEATRFYDNTGRAVADVRVGKDRYGIWFAGMARPGATQEDLYAFAASDVSGHWEYTKSGRMTLTGLPAVNVGGFPKGWMTYAEFRGGLAASAGVIEDGCGTWDSLSTDAQDDALPSIDERLSRIEMAIGEMYAAHLRSQE